MEGFFVLVKFPAAAVAPSVSAAVVVPEDLALDLGDSLQGLPAKCFGVPGLHACKSIQYINTLAVSHL